MARKEVWPPKIVNHRGRARVRIHGKDHYLGPWGSAEANEAYRKLISEHQPKEGNMTGAVFPTIAFLCEAFLKAKRAERGPAWKELIQYEYSFRALHRLHGQRKAADFKARDLESLQIALATGSWMTDSEKTEYAKRGKPIGVSRGVIRHRIGRIRTMWSWAEREGHAPEGSTAHLKTARAPDLQDTRVRKTTRTKPTSRADLDQVLPFCPKPVAAMLELQFLTGMRSGEVRTMRPGEIDRSVDPWVYRPSQHKNKWRGQERVIHLGQQCQAILAPWLEGKAPTEYIFKPCYRHKQKHPLYSQETYAQAVRYACKRAGVKFVPYDNRRSFAMRVAKEFGPEACRNAMGHAQLETQNIYKSIDQDQAANVAKKIG